MALQRLSPHLYRCADTCNVYALLCGEEAVLIDFGSGAILPHLAQAGVRRVSDILMTHHHRDQGQGLVDGKLNTAPAGVLSRSARIWAPHTEQELFQDVEAHWQARPIINDYNTRQDRFSLLQNVHLAGTLKDYARREFGPYALTVWPTPGHTTGSITLLTTVDGQRVAFSGDLIAAPGQLWSLAATQWSYNGVEGAAASILSLLSLKEQRPDVLLPSHGEPIYEVDAAIDLLVERLWELVRETKLNPRLLELRSRPFEVLTPHLLFNRTSMANSYVLRSESGKAIFFDFGYDFFVGGAAGSDRASRRPWLYNLEALKRQHGVTQVEAVVLTHFHDDHVAGLNLLREVEGTEVWAAETFANILQEPRRYDLPCLWYDPIAVDRVLFQDEPLYWEEYELALHPLPGHTRYAVAISLQVDGHRVLVSGDQYRGEGGLLWNHVYHNDFQADDYVASAELYRRLAPDLILSGHWQPLWTQDGYFETIGRSGEQLARLHRQLLPAEALNAGAKGFLASIVPYQLTAVAGEPFELCVEVRSPLEQEAEANVALAAPAGWCVEPESHSLLLPARGSARRPFCVTPPAEIQARRSGARRSRVAADVTIGARRWGQQAEALITVSQEQSGAW